MIKNQHPQTFQYRSFLLRIWLENPESDSPWRITVINPETGNRHGFADLEGLTAYLQTAFEPNPHNSQDQGEN